jgi:hypothetical protein
MKPNKELAMRYMVIVKTTPEADRAAGLPDPKDFEAMGKFNQELVKAGVMLSAEGLRPSSKGVKIRFDGGKRTVRDGPFTEAKELIAGFWIIQVKSKDEAIEWMKRAPFDGGAEIELREVFETDDFASIATDDHLQRMKDFRGKTGER